jgi:phage-related tail fiber protein
MSSVIVQGGTSSPPTPTSKIKIKRSEVSGNPAVLGAGELAYSGLADNGSNGGDRLYIGMGTETAGNAVNHVVIGGKYFTDQITAATSAGLPGRLVRLDASGSFTATTVTASLAGNAYTASSWVTARSISLTGDATATFASVDGSANVTTAITLANSGVSAGTYGGSGNIPVINVDSKGRITSAYNIGVSTVLGINADTGTGGLTLGTSNLVFAGGTGVSTSFNNSSSTLTFAIGQAVSPTSDVTFNNVTVNGSLASDDITAANISVAGNATITGNLTVQGTTTTINSTNLAVADVNITLAKDATTAAAANGAGLTVTGPATAAKLTYLSADDSWNFNKNLKVANVYGALVGNADTATKWATARSISITGDATWTTSIDGSGNATGAITLAASGVTAGTYTSVTVDAKGRVTAGTSATYLSASDIGSSVQAYDADLGAIAALAGTSGLLKKTADNTWALDTSTYLTANQSITVSGDVTGSGTTSIALTLATVNSNVGTYGSGTSVPTLTVNAKGLVTAVSTTAIPTATSSVLGLASFDSTNFTVTSGAVTIASIDGGTY